MKSFYGFTQQQEEELLSLRADIPRLKSQISSLTDQNIIKTQTIQILQNQLRDEQHTSQDSSIRIRTLEQELERNIQNNNLLQIENEDKITALQNQLRDEQHNAVRLESELIKLETELSVSQNYNHSLQKDTEDQINDLKAKLTAQAQGIAPVDHTKIKELEESLEQEKQKSELLGCKIQAIEKDLMEEAQDNSLKQAEYEYKLNTFNHLLASEIQANSKLQAANEQICNLLKQLSARLKIIENGQTHPSLPQTDSTELFTQFPSNTFIDHQGSNNTLPIDVTGTLDSVTLLNLGQQNDPSSFVNLSLNPSVSSITGILPTLSNILVEQSFELSGDLNHDS